MNSNFKCENCGKEVSAEAIGTKNRNHCPFCLYSKHVDLDVSGDRKATCHGLMEPVGLTFKEEGQDKYGHKKRGELMLIHLCKKCGDISINRIAGDDDEKTLLENFNNSLRNSAELNDKIKKQNLIISGKNDEKEIRTQLFGNLN